MTREQLQERINKLESKIQKTIKNKDKYYNNLSSEVKKLADNEVGKRWEERRNLNLEWEDETNLDMYYTKLFELRDFENTLNKYKNQINALENLVEIPVLRDFLNNWKESAIEYNVRCYESCKEEYKKHTNLSYKEYNEKIRRLTDLYSNYILSLVIYNSRNAVEQIKKDVEREAQKKYEVLINRINDIVGVITNCDYLRIGSNGEINGTIEGNKGKAKVETIVAGGYNEHIIVNVKHGQCAHYRVLVKELN